MFRKAGLAGPDDLRRRKTQDRKAVKRSLRVMELIAQTRRAILHQTPLTGPIGLRIRPNFLFEAVLSRLVAFFPECCIVMNGSKYRSDSRTHGNMPWFRAEHLLLDYDQALLSRSKQDLPWECHSEVAMRNVAILFLPMAVPILAAKSVHIVVPGVRLEF